MRLEHKDEDYGGVGINTTKNDEKESKRADIVAVMIIVAIVAAVVINALI
ncbi:MAG: hypothetical protein MJZ26_09160 [Fibrobacter sp.]|nr:hypothetical protein [Fibrobacter sp.]